MSVPQPSNQTSLLYDLPLLQRLRARRESGMFVSEDSASGLPANAVSLASQHAPRSHQSFRFDSGRVSIDPESSPRARHSEYGVRWCPQPDNLRTRSWFPDLEQV